MNILIFIISAFPIFYLLTKSKNFIEQLFCMSIIMLNWLILDYKFDEILKNFIFVFVSNVLIFIVALLLFNNNLKYSSERSIENSKYNMPIVYILMGVSFYGLILSVDGYENLFFSWIVVKDEMSNNTSSRLISVISFVISLGFFLQYKTSIQGKKINFNIFMALLIFASYVMALRVKLFFVPVVLIYLYPSACSALNFGQLIKLISFGLIGYLAVMSARWQGDLDGATIESFSETIKRVYDAGIEREMYLQSTTIFEYFLNHDSNIGSSFRRIILMPLSVIDIVNQYIPNNPMYEYYSIYNNGVYVEGGSAHPGIYSDSFAEWGWAGVFVPCLTYSILMYLVPRKNGILSSLSLAFIFISMPLLIRGSTYYGYLYLMPAFFFFAISSFTKR